MKSELLRGRPREGWLLFVVLLALVVRLGYAFVSAQVDPFLRSDPLHGDAASYDRLVRNLIGGLGFTEAPGFASAFWPPLYPFFLTGMYTVFGYSLLAARLAQGLLGAIAVGAACAATRIVLGRRVAILASLGMALYPYLVYFGNWLIAEALYMALLTTALLMMVRLQQRSTWPRAAGLGALLGLGILAKPSALMMLPMVAIWAVVALPFATIARRLGRVAVVILAAALVVAPWTVRNCLAFDDFVLVSTNGGYTFYGANNPQAFGGHREGFPPPLPALTEPQAEHEYYRLGMAWIMGHPADFAGLAVRKLARLFSPLSVASWEADFPLPRAIGALIRGTYWGFLALAVAGVLLSLRRWREACVLVIPILGVLAGTVIFYGDVRYTLPMVPSLLAFASTALVFARDRWSARGVPLSHSAEGSHG